MDLINAAYATITTGIIITGLGWVMTMIIREDALKGAGIIATVIGVLGIIAAVWMFAAAGVLDN